MEVLQAKNLKKIYGSGNNAVHALDGVDLSVKKGEFVAIVGTSGSGKSTLLHMLGGLDRPTSGTVMVDGQDFFSLKEEALTIFRRRKIGFVFQAYNLVPVLNVYENIVLPIELDGGKVNKDFVQQIVQTLGLDDRLDALPNQLSGGQQQRVAIARALAAAPAIILADHAFRCINSGKITGYFFSHIFLFDLISINLKSTGTDTGKELCMRPQLRYNRFLKPLHENSPQFLRSLRHGVNFL